jgi:uncharacterized phage-associated protein
LISANNLANNIIRRSLDEKIEVTPMKLQKLLYFIYKKHLQKTGKPLFAESFLAWKYGPVIQSVYDEFKAFGSTRITKFARDSFGDVYLINENENLQLACILNDVWTKYKGFNGIQLSIMTHQPGTAWDKSVKNETFILKDEDIKNEQELC